GGSGQGQDPLLYPAAQGADQPTADPGSGLPAAQPGLPGLIGLFGTYWHLSACAQPSVRDVLALTPLTNGGGHRPLFWGGRRLGLSQPACFTFFLNPRPRPPFDVDACSIFSSATRRSMPRLAFTAFSFVFSLIVARLTTEPSSGIAVSTRSA